MLASIVGGVPPLVAGKGGATLAPELVLLGLVLPGLVLPVVGLLGVVAGLALAGLLSGMALAAARVAKTRAEMTLNCILFFFCYSAENLSTEDCLNEESR